MLTAYTWRFVEMPSPWFPPDPHMVGDLACQDPGMGGSVRLKSKRQKVGRHWLFEVLIVDSTIPTTQRLVLVVTM